MILVDGKKIADRMLGDLRSGLASRSALGEILRSDLKSQPRLNLASILVGDINNARKFLEVKQKAAKKIGIGFKIHEFSEDTAQEKLEEEIKKIVDGDKNNGVIIELPLPDHLDTQKVLDLIPPEKDPDVLSSKTQYNFFTEKSPILPPAVEAVKQIFEEYKVGIKNKKVVVFGHGILVGKPCAIWLMQQGTDVKIVDEWTSEDESKKSAIEADIIVTGVGKPNLITEDMVKPGVIIIDFGYTAETQNINGTKENKIAGDINSEALSKASIATPVPGGVGPIVVAAVLKNLVILAK